MLRKKEWQIDGLKVGTAVLATVMSLLLVLPIVALVWRTISTQSTWTFDTTAVLAALGLSLLTTAVSLLIILILGTPLALAFARYTFPGKRVLAVFVEMPIVMPPVVAGLALLAAFGRRGLLGQPLSLWGISIPFTWVAVVLAQVFVAAPFYIRAAQARFGALPRDLEAAANMDGASGWQTFQHITIPLSYRALLAGLTLSWARALGEFGATILFAGNLQGRTQTMPLLVYGALERDLNAAYITALILLSLAAMALFVTRWLTRLDDTAVDPLADL